MFLYFYYFYSFSDVTIVGKYTLNRENRRYYDKKSMDDKMKKQNKLFDFLGWKHGK